MLYFLIKQSWTVVSFQRSYLYGRRADRKVSFGSFEAGWVYMNKFFGLSQSSRKDKDSWWR